MKEYRNCLNCGAPLQYDETNYGSIAKCKYCKTEYHIDKLGRVEEYKVKLKLQNKIISFYIGEIRYEPIILDTSRLVDGRVHIERTKTVIELNLISYDMEDIKDENN